MTAFYLVTDQAIPPMQVVLVFVALLLSLSLIAAWSVVPRLMRAIAVSAMGAVLVIDWPSFVYCCVCRWCWF